MTEEKESWETLLDKENYISNDELKQFKLATVWRLRFFILLGFSIPTLLTLAGITLYLSKLPRITSSQMDGIIQPYSPADQHIKYTNRYLIKDPEAHTFLGKPRPELDAAWHGLLEGNFIRISEEEYKQTSSGPAVAHKDGGYMAMLGISHSLHCLHVIKQFTNWDYYNNSVAENWEEMEHHTNHCLESLRQDAMCRPDLSVYPLRWIGKPGEVVTRAKPPQRPHACVDFPVLHDWMRERAASEHDMVPPPTEV